MKSGDEIVNGLSYTKLNYIPITPCTCLTCTPILALSCSVTPLLLSPYTPYLHSSPHFYRFSLAINLTPPLTPFPSHSILPHSHSSPNMRHSSPHSFYPLTPPPAHISHSHSSPTTATVTLTLQYVPFYSATISPISHSHGFQLLRGTSSDDGLRNALKHGVLPESRCALSLHS